MPRTIRDSALETRAARARLQSRGKPYYRAIEPGLHLGYRKPKGRRGNQTAGKWVVRLYVGGQSYELETIATADDFSDADGVAILSYKQAQDEARRRLVWGAHRAAGKAAGPFTVQVAVEEYLEFLENSRKSIIDSRARAEAFVYPMLGHLAVEMLTTKQLRDWHVGLAKVPPRLRTRKGEPQKHREISGDEEAIRRRRSTANRTLTVLKAALNHAFNSNEKGVSSDHAWRKVKPFKGVDAARIRYLTVSEAQRLLNACEPDFRSLAQAALLTGARYSELARLKVADFNRDSETLSVWMSKSNKPRHVELTDEGVRFFKQVCAGRAGDELMFKGKSGNAWAMSHQLRPMAEACQRAKILPPIGFHGLRHTWASLAVMNGVPLLVVAHNLGHADTRMVEKHYGHLAPSYIRDAIRAGAPKFGIAEGSKVAELV